MIKDFSQLWLILLQTAGILCVLLVIYKRYIISFFDPLFFFILTQAFSMELAFLVIKDTYYLVNILCCEAAMALGFIMLSPSAKKLNITNNKSILHISEGQFLKIKLFAVVSFWFIVFMNMILISQKGLAITSSDASEAKVANFVEGGGLGFVRRINWGLIYLTCFTFIYLFLLANKKEYLLYLSVLVLILGTSGSKGAVLSLIQAFVFFGLVKQLTQLQSFRTLKKISFLLLPLAIVLALYIMTGYRDDDDVNVFGSSIFSFVTRFLFFGDAMLSYYDFYSVKHFISYNFVNFINVEFNSVLGLFRVVDYRAPLGFELTMYQFDLKEVPIFGPNVPFYVKGHIFFGYWGAILYSFVIGGIIGGVRKLMFLSYQKESNAIICILIIFLNAEVYGIAQDSALFMSVLFDTLICSIPVLIIVLLILAGNQQFFSGKNVSRFTR